MRNELSILIAEAITVYFLALTGGACPEEAEKSGLACEKRRFSSPGVENPRD